MAKAQPLLVVLPFCGFYESNLSGALDLEAEQWVEYHCEPQGEQGEDYESSYPEPLRITSDEMSNLMFDAQDFKKAELKLAGYYLDAFDHAAGEAFDLSRPDTRSRWNSERGDFVKEAYRRPSIGLTFESMTSPREYNFATDRLFAYIPRATVREMWRRSKADGHKALAQVIADNCTSYDGFHSFYSNDLDSWIAKPVLEWDHNELGILLVAALKLAGENPREFMRQCEDSAVEDEGAYQAWEAGVDWPKLDEARALLRASKLDDWREEDPQAAAAYAGDATGELPAIRDPNTLDLFEPRPQ